ncbi:hypothetical protein GC248_14670 [Acetobacter senegalensis]|nr:hypothetical protein [Acetobacter senegalensis]
MEPDFIAHPEDQITREGLIARFYNAYSTDVKTKDEALNLVSEIAQAVDGRRTDARYKPMQPPTNPPKTI